MDSIATLQSFIQSSPYIQAWLIYLAGVIGCLLVFWRITDFMWPFLQLFLRAIVATLLLMPIRLQSGIDYWVPTTIFVGMKTITKDFSGAMPGVRQLLLVSVALVITSWLVHGLLILHRRKRQQEKASSPRSSENHSNNNGKSPVSR
jgi:hypothetical protein